MAGRSPAALGPELVPQSSGELCAHSFEKQLSAHSLGALSPRDLQVHPKPAPLVEWEEGAREGGGPPRKRRAGWRGRGDAEVYWDLLVEKGRRGMAGSQHKRLPNRMTEEGTTNPRDGTRHDAHPRASCLRVRGEEAAGKRPVWVRPAGAPSGRLRVRPSHLRHRNWAGAAHASADRRGPERVGATRGPSAGKHRHNTIQKKKKKGFRGGRKISRRGVKPIVPRAGDTVWALC